VHSAEFTQKVGLVNGSIVEDHVSGQLLSHSALFPYQILVNFIELIEFGLNFLLKALCGFIAAFETYSMIALFGLILKVKWEVGVYFFLYDVSELLGD